MFKIIWWGLAYMLIFTERTQDGSWLAVRFREYQPASKRVMYREASTAETLEAQNFGFCLLPA